MGNTFLQKCLIAGCYKIDATELDEAECDLQFLVHAETFNAERMDVNRNNSLELISFIAQLSVFVGPNSLIQSAGRIKRLVEIKFDEKYVIIPNARQKNYQQYIDYLRAEVKEPYVSLKLRSSLRSIISICVKCTTVRAARVKKSLHTNLLPQPTPVT